MPPGRRTRCDSRCAGRLEGSPAGATRDPHGRDVLMHGRRTTVVAVLARPLFAAAAHGHPRLHFMGRPALYKLYVVAPGGAEAAPGADPAVDGFLTAFLAALRDALFARPVA